MGTRLQNWLAKTTNKQTRDLNRRRWNQFAQWCVTATNPLTGQPYFQCQPEEVDDQIRQDFEAMKTALFLDKYKDVLTKYCASLSDLKNNSINSYMGSVKAFFSSEAISIKLSSGKIPSLELATGEHEFTREQLQSMWQVADWEGKARISTALLGWGVGDFLALKVADIKQLLTEVDQDGFVAFITSRIKTRRHSVKAVGILISEAVVDLEKYLSTIPSSQEYLWTTRTPQGINVWLRSLADKAGIKPTGQIRFHLFRKFIFTIAEYTVDSKFAKLIVGKKVNYSDLTYMQGLKQRVLKQYKEKIYPLINLKPETHSQYQDLQTQMDHQSQEIKALKTSLHTLQEINVEQGQHLHTLKEQIIQLKRYSYEDRLQTIYIQQQEIALHISSFLKLNQVQPNQSITQQIKALYERGLDLYQQQNRILERIKQKDPAYLQASLQEQKVFGTKLSPTIQILTELGFAFPAHEVKQLQSILKA